MALSRKFNLLRFFSVSSFFLILLIGAVIIFASRQMLTAQLVKSGETANVALANSIANAMWEQHAEYVMNTPETDGEVLRNRPETALIHEELKNLVRNINVLKVKIYNRDAVTIYSSEVSQIGESKAQNPGFLTSLHQQAPASKLSRRGSFSAFSGQISNVALVETYVPIINPRTNRLESVFELYSNVSALTKRIDDTILQLSYLLAGVLLLLYLGLFYVIRQASNTIDQQRAELERHQELLESANDAMAKEMNERKEAEKRLAASRIQTEDSKVLPLVQKMCEGVAKVYLEIAGADRIDDVKTAYNNWRENKFRGPSSINIFISLLSKNLDGVQQSSFETRAQDCIHL